MCKFERKPTVDSYNECLFPLRFKESLFLWKDAFLVMTDSGGLTDFHLRLKNVDISDIN